MVNISLSCKSAKPGLKLAEIQERKTYAQAQISEVVDLRSFANHIASHGSVYRQADIQAVLLKTVDCLYEMLLEGKKVEFGDLGFFSPKILSEGVEVAADYSSRNIKKLTAKWSPGPMFRDMTSGAEFQLVPSRKGQAKVLKQERGLDVTEDEANAGGNAVQPGNGNGGNNNEGGQQPGGNGGGDDGGNNGDGIE